MKLERKKMRKYQNLHTHTTFCDGMLTPEGMVTAAIETGGGSIGFSEHSYVPFDKEFSMKIEDTPKYIQDVNALKNIYDDRIEIFLGIELDYFTAGLHDGLDYIKKMDFIIGTSHHLEHEGKHITVDGSAKHFAEMSSMHFHGDYYAMAEAYYKVIEKTVDKTNADIVGHFDLIAKRNIDGCFFDETHPRYVKAALDAMDAVLTKCKVFEVNTGAMYRVGKKEPYPSMYLLKQLCKRGGEIILSSDSHNADSLYYKFEDIREMVISCGFKYIKRLTKNGFINEKL